MTESTSRSPIPDQETAERKLGDVRWIPSLDEATALRDLLAAHLHSDPGLADRLSAAFLHTIQKRRKSPPALQAIAYRARAEALLYTGRLKAARSAYERACRHAEASRDGRLLGQILVGRIGTLLAMGDAAGTAPLVRQARRLLLAGGDDDYLRRLFINLGSGHYHRERYGAAHRANAEAIRLMDAAGQRDHVWASVQLNQGIACTQLSLIEEARSRFHLVEEFSRAHGLDHLSAQARFNLGSLEALRGDYRAALTLLSGADETFARQDARDLLAASYLEQAQIYLDLGMPAEAHELAGRAYASFAEEEMLLDAQLARLAEARSLLLLDRPSAAAALLTDTLRFYEQRRIQPRRAYVLLELARTWAARGDRARAREAAHGALRLARRPGLEVLDTSCRCFLADLLLAAGETTRASATLRPAVLREGHLTAQGRMALHQSLGRIARARGRTREALAEYGRASRYLELQRALIPGLELRARSFERDVSVYHEQIALLSRIRGARVDRLLGLMETARGRAFRELPSGAGAAAGAEFLDLRTELASVTRLIEAGGGNASPSPDLDPVRLQRRARLLEGKISSRLRRLESTAPAPVRRRGARLAGQVGEMLARHECFVEYFVSDEQILVVVITRENSTLRILEAPASQIRGILEHLRLQVNTMAATADRPIGSLDFHRRHAEARLADLYRDLVQPVLDLADQVVPPAGREQDETLPRRGRLIIVAHDCLHEVPFECLHDGSDYLDADWEILRCPNADFLLDRRRRPPAQGAGPPVVIAGTRPDAPWIEAESRAVARRWSRDGAGLLVDPDPAQVLEAISSAGLVHVSAHSTFRRDNPLFSTLHFRGDVLFLADLLDIRTTAELVVLSACSTGEVLSGRGDALLGVAHAFLACGSNRLVASLWRVHDEATAAWMDRFYESYALRRDPVAALRQAGRELRAAWPHPFYWGGFCVLGA